MLRADKLPVDHMLRETTRHGTVGFPIQYYVDELFKFENRRVPLHWHPELEFLVVNGGSVRIQLGEQERVLAEGDGIFINGNILHMFEQELPSDRCQNPNIVFSAELIAPMTSSPYQKYVKPVIEDCDLPFAILRAEIGWQNEILEHLSLVFALLYKYGPEGSYGTLPRLPNRFDSIEAPCFELTVQREMNAIWQILYEHLGEIPRIRLDKKRYQSQIRIQRMLEYIHAHYSESITLRSFSEAAGISKSEVFRCFHSYLGSSPVEYLLRYRIEKARGLLCSTGQSIKEVSRDCGFRSESYFSKVFRERVGTSPREYRRRLDGS